MSISGKQAFSSTRNNQPNHLATMNTLALDGTGAATT
jgi:hypothetical protein